MRSKFFLHQDLMQLGALLIENLQGFLLELGKGFALVAHQQRSSTDSKDFSVDLIFYNYLLKCFVLFDLKRKSCHTMTLVRWICTSAFTTTSGEVLTTIQLSASSSAPKRMLP
jgi:hypothetical protein